MGRKRNRKPLLENIEIVKLAAEGKAIAKVDDKVVFVTNVIPGDVVDVQVTKNVKVIWRVILLYFINILI